MDTWILDKMQSLISELQTTKGTNAKIELLKNYEELKPLIKRIWDPNTTTGLTKKGIEDYISKHDETFTTSMSLYQLMDDLVARRLTGHAARAAAAEFISRYPAHRELILRILEKKPRIRMAAKLLLKAFPGLFTIFAVTLATEYTEEEFAKQLELAHGHRAWMSKKIDGVRLITVIHKDEIKFYSRVGNEFTSLDRLRDDIRLKVVPELIPEEIADGIVFDGEIIALDADGRENFKETVSQVRQLRTQMINPRYLIFDVLDLRVFNGSDKGPLLEERIKHLADIFVDTKSKHCTPLEMTLWSAEKFQRMKTQAVKAGWEGLIIRFNSLYEPKRTPRLLKFKFFQREEYKVVDIVVENMKFPNSTGGEDTIEAVKNLIILHKDNKVGVGSGLTTDDRVQWAKNPGLIKGKMVNIKFQEEFYDPKTSKYSLRCPIFEGIIGDARDY